MVKDNDCCEKQNSNENKQNDLIFKQRKQLTYLIFDDVNKFPRSYNNNVSNSSTIKPNELKNHGKSNQYTNYGGKLPSSSSNEESSLKRLEYILLIVLLCSALASLVLSIWSAFVSQSQLVLARRTFYWFYLFYSIMVVFIVIYSIEVLLPTKENMNDYTTMGTRLMLVMLGDFLYFTHLVFVDLTHLKWNSTTVRGFPVVAYLVPYVVALMRILIIPWFIYLFNSNLSAEKWDTSEETKIPSTSKVMMPQCPPATAPHTMAIGIYTKEVVTTPYIKVSTSPVPLTMNGKMTKLDQTREKSQLETKHSKTIAL